MGSVRKRPTGRWEARWYSPEGRQKSRNFSTKADAQRYLREMARLKDRGEVVPSDVSFRDVAEDWFVTDRHRWRAKTAAGYRRILDYSLLGVRSPNRPKHPWPEFADTAVSRIKVATVKDLIGALAEEGISATTQ